jgi:hypothetical protein
MHYMGTNLTFRGNVIRNSPLVVYQVSPDVFENFASVRYQGILFERNFVYGFDGVLASQKGTTGNSDGLTYTHNVFVEVGSFSMRYPNSSFINNTFVNVSAESNPVTQALRHAVIFDALHTDNATLINNIFVGCGAGGVVDTRGWYQFNGDTINSAVMGNNFVAGPAPEFAPKSGFFESAPELNGGDPGFVNINDPLGPDGAAFTDDDGLRLRADSKLRGAGVGGLDLGAYAYVREPPTLAVTRLSSSLLRLSWPSSAQGFKLEDASEVSGVWADADLTPVLEGEAMVVVLEATNGTRFYRLVK